jgi:hypothetical protein
MKLATATSLTMRGVSEAWPTGGGSTAAATVMCFSLSMIWRRRFTGRSVDLV